MLISDLGEFALIDRLQQRLSNTALRQVVRGVAISRRSVGMDDWLQALAQDVARAAARDTAARQALERLLRG